MSADKERVLDHEYDGIREYDNPLPRWWTWIFWASIVFALAYAWNPGGVFHGKRIDEYQRAMADAGKRFPPSSGGGDLAALALLEKDPAALALGQTTYAAYCAACHRLDAGGLIGPDLTDDYWLHGGTIAAVHKTVTEGVLNMGMPPWGKTLKPEQINAVVVYVMSLHDSHPPNPKARQGVKVED